jgi:hypothetical protein
MRYSAYDGTEVMAKIGAVFGQCVLLRQDLVYPGLANVLLHSMLHPLKVPGIILTSASRASWLYSPLYTVMIMMRSYSHYFILRASIQTNPVRNQSDFPISSRLFPMTSSSSDWTCVAYICHIHNHHHSSHISHSDRHQVSPAIDRRRAGSYCPCCLEARGSRRCGNACCL